MTDELTDAQLDEAVAVEVFGHSHREVCNTCPNGEATSPTSDAHDAERVLLWLVKKTPGTPIIPAVEILLWGEGRAEVRPYEYGVAYLNKGCCVPDIDWKRALCLAALAVARKEKP